MDVSIVPGQVRGRSKSNIGGPDYQVPAAPGAPCDRESKLILTKGSFAVEAGGGTEFLFDAEELVVFGDAVGAAAGAGFDLAGGGSDGEIGDKGVLGFAGTVRDDGVVAGFAGQLDGVDGFGDRADLIELNKNGVGDAFVDAAGEALRAGDEKVVADKLDFFLRRFAADTLRQGFPARPIVLRHAVFEGNDGIFVRPLRPILDH